MDVVELSWDLAEESCREAEETANLSSEGGFRALGGKIQTSRSWKSTAQGGLLGTGLEEAIGTKIVTYPGGPPRAKKEKI